MREAIAAVITIGLMILSFGFGRYEHGKRDVAAVVVAGGGIPGTLVMVKGSGRLEIIRLPKADSPEGISLIERLTVLPKTSKIGIVGQCPNRPMVLDTDGSL